MLNLFKQFFESKIIADLPLEFGLDLNEHEQHVVTTYMIINGQKEKVTNISEFWDYGFIFKRNGKQYAVSRESLEILLSLRSLNPNIQDDGTMVFDLCPPILRYLRSRKTFINESKHSEDELKISNKTLKPSLNVDYEPDEGLIIKAGYSIEGEKDLFETSKINVTSDGNYAKLANTFYPISEEVDPAIDKWFDKKETLVLLDNIPEFFKRDLVLIKTRLGAVLTPRAAAIDIIEDRFKPVVKINKNEQGWLDFKVDYVVGKFRLPYKLVKEAQQAQKSYIHNDDNSWVRLDKDAAEKTDKYLDDLGAEKTSEGFRIPVERFYSVEEFVEKIGGLKELTSEYQNFLNEMTDFQADENFKLPDEIENCLTSQGCTLRPYQRAGIHWMIWLTSHHLHGILADDMGLGKTIQTIITVRMSYEKENIPKHSLIICPKSVLPFWVREINKWYPQAKVYEYIGPSRDSTLFNHAEVIIFITTYETFTRDMPTIQSIPFYFVVLDEATKIKNPGVERTKAIKSLNSLHRVALSGTPIENRPAELWSLFDFLMKGFLGTHGGFSRLFENPITSGDNAAISNLSKRIRPFLLRRLKSDVAKDLPEKIRMMEYCELTEEQKSLYGQIQDTYVSPVRDSLQRGEVINYTSSILPILTKLKQVCDHPALITGSKEPLENRSEKFDMVINKVLEIKSIGELTVVFTHFLGTLDLLEAAFNKIEITYIRIDGSTENRQILIDKFNDRKVDVAICSIQACGHGINLIAANHVIHIDHWWNPAIEDQATDRVHRIGQDKTVYVYSILTKGTLEEKIALLLERKRDISDKVIGAATREKMQWTKEELLEILKPLE